MALHNVLFCRCARLLSALPLTGVSLTAVLLAAVPATPLLLTGLSVLSALVSSLCLCLWYSQGKTKSCVRDSYGGARQPGLNAASLLSPKLCPHCLSSMPAYARGVCSPDQCVGDSHSCGPVFFPLLCCLPSCACACLFGVFAWGLFPHQIPVSVTATVAAAWRLNAAHHLRLSGEHRDGGYSEVEDDTQWELKQVWGSKGICKYEPQVHGRKTSASMS